MKKVLSIVETGFRATLEEQDDTVVWFSHALRGAQAELTLVLRGNAVVYAAKAQDTQGLAFGARKQTRPPTLHEDLAALARKNVPVLLVQEDVARYGLKRDDLIAEVDLIPRARIAELADAHDLVWWW